MAGGVHGKSGIHGGGRAWQVCAWQERRPVQRRVRILLECILAKCMIVLGERGPR